MKQGLAEVVNQIAEAKTKKQKIELLHQNDSGALRGIFQLAYDNRVKWALPEGRPPYRPLEKSFDAQGMLLKEMRRMYLFLENGNPNLKPMRREQLFINMLEEIDCDDAILVLNCKERKIPGVTKAVVKEAYPGFLNEPENQDKK
jgi:hypothetical protein